MRFARLLDGALAGLIATGPMTLTMVVLFRRLPGPERYFLPPREITSRVTAAAGIEERLTPSQQTVLTLLAHFAYGTGAGAGYATVARLIPLPGVVKGVLFGLAIWAGSYLGWLPALRILRPATEHPEHRTALMIAAHVVWGATAGLIYDELEQGGEIAGFGHWEPAER